MVIGLLALAAQAVSALPPAAPVSQPAFDHADVLIPIDAAFAAFEAGDGAALLRHVYPNGRVTAVGTTPSGSHGVRESSFAEFATKLSSGGGFRERISDPAIEVDGDIALVWAPFTVEIGGKVASCGTDHFDLVRQSGVWKIMNITFSSRTSGCPGQ